MDLKLTEKDFEFLHKILKSNVCDFDCGKICAEKNKGIPYCCDIDSVVPVLFKNEYKYLMGKTDLWREFVPEDEDDEKLFENIGYDDVLAICKGHKKCKREFRGFICRSFPFYPFIDESMNFIGMTYNYDFKDKCIILENPYIISKTYIEEFMKAWQYIFLKDKDELTSHYNYSRFIEEKRKKEIIHIINNEGIYEYSYSR